MKKKWLLTLEIPVTLADNVDYPGSTAKRSQKFMIWEEGDDRRLVTYVLLPDPRSISSSIPIPLPGLADHVDVGEIISELRENAMEFDKFLTANKQS